MTGAEAIIDLLRAVELTPEQSTTVSALAIQRRRFEQAARLEPKAHAALLAEEMHESFQQGNAALGIENVGNWRPLFEAIADGIVTAVDAADKQRTMRSVWRAVNR